MKHIRRNLLYFCLSAASSPVSRVALLATSSELCLSFSLLIVINAKLPHSFCSCSTGGEGPPTDNGTCQRIRPDWVPLQANFFRVNHATTVADIQNFAATLTTPAGTEAVGTFSGSCLLADDPFRQTALIVNYCGPAPPPPTPEATPDTPVALAAVDNLEADTAEVLQTALLS
jgi:hypothetical protein